MRAASCAQQAASLHVLLVLHPPAALPLPSAQVKALDTEAVEACPHKGAVEAADEIRGLLEGSRQVRLV